MRVVRASGIFYGRIDLKDIDLEGFDLEGTDFRTLYVAEVVEESQIVKLYNWYMHLKKHKLLAWSPELKDSYLRRSRLCWLREELWSTVVICHAEHRNMWRDQINEKLNAITFDVPPSREQL